jgi:tetratricopeptide (TPR) repeat protein
MIKKILLNTVFLSVVISTTGQIHNCDVYQGYLSGEMAVWSKGIAEQEAKYLRSGTNDDLYVLILSKYGYIGYLISMKREGEAKDIISSAEKNTEKMAADPKFEARASALRGALTAMRISLNPIRATYLGMRSLKQIEASLKLDQNDPTGWVEMGNARYHMPSIVGGSFSEAARCFSQAVMLFEKEPSLLKCNWHYLHALVWLAKSYESMDNLQGAKEIYEKLLSIEPGFQWVKKELYPELLNKIELSSFKLSATD